MAQHYGIDSVITAAAVAPAFAPRAVAVTRVTATTTAE